MINIDFIAGIAIGALQAPACNLYECDNDTYSWVEDPNEVGWGDLIMSYKCAHELSTLNKAKEMVSSFCDCDTVIVGQGYIKFIIKEASLEGGEPCK